jgi:hypothetical protein
MVNLLNEIKGNISVNGVAYSSGKAANIALDGYSGDMVVVLGKTENKIIKQPNNPIGTVSDDTLYAVTVKPYMTRPSTIDFDFHLKWNNDIEMPLRTMMGKKLKETKGMVYMELYGFIDGKEKSHCMKCGRPLTHRISRYYGLGPECGEHYYNLSDSVDEQQLAEANKRIKLKTAWTGWVVKSAILEEVIC